MYSGDALPDEDYIQVRISTDVACIVSVSIDINDPTISIAGRVYGDVSGLDPVYSLWAVYVNDINVFGYQRGTGESIWEIKQFIGYVSTALQWEYTVSTSLRNVIISGFHDSIGLYTKSTDTEKAIADEWLALLGMSDRADEPFNRLSFGDQRLVLIARAMVKHPPLLILDEPCLGLDDMNRQLVLALVERICLGSETSVLYVNHREQDRVAGIGNHLTLTRNTTA